MKYSKLVAGLCGFAITASMAGQTLTTAFASENYNQVVKDNHVYNITEDGIDWENPVTLDPMADYYDLMKKAASDGNSKLGALYEKLRNSKVSDDTSYFTEGVSAENALASMTADEKKVLWEDAMSKATTRDDYLNLMYVLAKDGSKEAIQYGKEVEKKRNSLLKEEGDYALYWWFFDLNANGADIAKKIEDLKEYEQQQRDFEKKMAEYDDESYDDSTTTTGGMGERYPNDSWQGGNGWDEYMNGNRSGIDYSGVVEDGDYPVARYMVKYLRERGFSDVVITGILGNSMTECGGQTLNLDWDVYGYMSPTDPYYGLFQWSLYYNPDVKDKDVPGQMDYLMSNLAHNIEMFGGSFDYFCSIQDPVEAALYFQQYYEKGENGDRRANNAAKVYEWVKSV